MARKPIINEKNPKDRNTRAPKLIKEKSKGVIPAKLPRMKNMKSK